MMPEMTSFFNKFQDTSKPLKSVDGLVIEHAVLNLFNPETLRDSHYKRLYNAIVKTPFNKNEGENELWSFKQILHDYYTPATGYFLKNAEGFQGVFDFFNSVHQDVKFNIDEKVEFYELVTQKNYIPDESIDAISESIELKNKRKRLYEAHLQAGELLAKGDFESYSQELQTIKYSCDDDDCEDISDSVISGFDNIMQTLADTPPLTPIISGLVDEESLVMIAGQPKVGKSWLTLQLADSIINAKPFLGCSCPRCRSVGIINTEISPRRYMERIQRTISVPNDKKLISLANISEENRIWKAIEEFAGTHDVVIIDCLYSILSDEIDQQEVNKVIRRLNHIRTVNKCTIVLVHHCTKGDSNSKYKTDMASGSSVISRAMETITNVIHTNLDSNLLKLSFVTRNFEEKPDANAVLENCRMVLIDEAPSSEVAASNTNRKPSKAELIIMDLKGNHEAWKQIFGINYEVGMSQKRLKDAVCNFCKVSNGSAERIITECIGYEITVTEKIINNSRTKMYTPIVHE